METRKSIKQDIYTYSCILVPFILAGISIYITKDLFHFEMALLFSIAYICFGLAISERIIALKKAIK